MSKCIMHHSHIICEWCCADVLREPVKLIFRDRGIIWWDWLSSAPFVFESCSTTHIGNKNQATRTFIFLTDFEKWGKDWTVNCLILTNVLSHTANYLHTLYYNVSLNCHNFKLHQQEVFPTSWSLSTHSGMSQASPSWDALVSSEAASFPKDHWAMRSWKKKKKIWVYRIKV